MAVVDASLSAKLSNVISCLRNLLFGSSPPPWKTGAVRNTDIYRRLVLRARSNSYLQLWPFVILIRIHGTTYFPEFRLRFNSLSLILEGY